MQREFFQLKQGAVAGRIRPVTNRPAEKLSSPALLSITYLGLAGPRTEQAYTYASHLAELLDGQINYIQADVKALSQQIIENTGLLIYEEPQQSWLKTWLCGPPACRVVSRWPVSVLVVRQPRWPLKKILLVTRGRPPDYPAVTWVVHLARPVKADITVLAVQPDLSTTNSQALGGEGVEPWLVSDTPLGQQLRYLAKAWGTAARRIDLRFLGGAPERQIQHAVAETQPDLIVIASEPADWWERRILGDLVTPLLCRADRPVLVAKSNY